MEQHQIKEGKLLNNEGNLNEPGYAFSLVKEYSRRDIKASSFKIKEWDYYYFGDDKYGLALTIADNSYMAMASISILNYVNKKNRTVSKIKWFTFGSTKLPSSSKTGDVSLIGKDYEMRFFNDNGKRHLVCSMENYEGNKTFFCDVYLEEKNPNSMVICTPFNKNKHFYYNQKINLLKATGSYKLGDFSYTFGENALGVLDWGRGVWTYKNTWYWSSLNGNFNGHNIGFNLGYGFGDTSAASENMFFVDDKVYKLDDVIFDIPKDSNGKDLFMKTWSFTSSKGDIALSFEPIFDRASDTNALIIRSNQHQVFGRFSGTIKTEDGDYTFENLIGFAEKVYNRW